MMERENYHVRNFRSDCKIYLDRENHLSGNEVYNRDKIYN